MWVIVDEIAAVVSLLRNDKNKYQYEDVGISVRGFWEKKKRVRGEVLKIKMQRMWE